MQVGYEKSRFSTNSYRFSQKIDTSRKIRNANRNSYRIYISNCTISSKVTLNLDYKTTILSNVNENDRTSCISIDWCHFQITLNDPNPEFKGTPSFDVEYLENGIR